MDPKHEQQGPEQGMEQGPEQKQSILTHLVAMRNMLIICAGAVLIGFLLVFLFAIDPLMEALVQPLRDKGLQVISTELTQALMSKIKVSLIAGLVLACPVMIWQIWRFISPALYAHEKKVFWTVFLSSVVLFLVGVAFCYGAVYLLTVQFFLDMGNGLVTAMPTIDKYIDYLFGFVVPFGLAFELPVALYLTTRMGLTNYQMLASKRKYIILAVAVIAAILTPPDVVSQIMLIIPILILFEVSLQIVRRVKPKAQQEEAA